MDRRKQHIVILGAGIAGLSAAYFLAQRGARRVTVLDEEPGAFFKASGLNAAIFRPLEADAVIAQLAARSSRTLDHLSKKHDASLVRRNGLLLVGPDAQALTRMNENAAQYGTPSSLLDAAGARIKLSGLTVDPAHRAVWSPAGGVLDPHAIGQVLLRELSLAGVVVRFCTRVRRLSLNGKGHCRGVELVSGERLEADATVLSAGAATGRLAFDIGAPLPLLPLQRHLAILETQNALPADAPVVWQLQPELYFRPESGGILVSPCDETPRVDGRVQANLDELSVLAERFERLFPGLAKARVRRSWACIRTKAPDTRPVIGPAPQVLGLHFATALAGFGMSCGLACGELSAESILDDRTPPEVAPARLYLPFSKESSSSSMRSAGVSRSSI